jgi:8-oxo-dGTP pyrophosphatase MutT (NUDIX family)
MLKESAVIVLHEQATDSLILTERAAHLRDHPSEICFPGGRWELGDDDLSDTALRELYEELGITKDRIQLIKKLDIEQTINGSIIHPWFATISMLKPYVRNSDEVARVLMLPMQMVNKLTHYNDIVVNRSGMQITTCQFTASQYFIWGATARIMKQLANL